MTLQNVDPGVCDDGDVWTLAVDNLPVGWEYTFSPSYRASLDPGDTRSLTLRVVASRTAPPGVYSLDLSAVSSAKDSHVRLR